MTDNGVPEVRLSPVPDGHILGQVNKTSTATSSTMKHSSSWDEDWIPTRRSSTNEQSSSMKTLTQPSVSSQSIQITSGYSQSTMTSSASSQLSASCPAVDVEWPPRSSQLDLTTQLGNNGNLNENKSSSGAGLDDIDPFANWPPRPSGSTSASGSSMNGAIALSANKHGSGYNSVAAPNGLSFQTSSNNSWAFNAQNSTESIRPNQGNSTLNFNSPNVGGLNSQNSLGFLKQNQGVSAYGASTEKATDLGSIFTSSKSEQSAPRLAPPPSTAVGRGRGRGRGNQGQLGSASASRGSHVKPQTEQPPLLDLL